MVGESPPGGRDAAPGDDASIIGTAIEIRCAERAAYLESAIHSGWMGSGLWFNIDPDPGPA